MFRPAAIRVANAPPGFALTPDEARDLAGAGVRIATAAADQPGFSHPGGPAGAGASFRRFAGPLTKADDALTGTNAAAIRPGEIDRAPCRAGRPPA